MVCAMSDSDWQSVLVENPDGVRVRVKVVPSARRTRLTSLLGNRLKVVVSAPPEGGRANKAVCRLIAKVLGVANRQVQVIEGRTRPQKTLEVLGVGHCAAIKRLEKAVREGR